jgi:integrase
MAAMGDGPGRGRCNAWRFWSSWRFTRSHYEDHGLVFCQANGQPIDPRNFTRYFERLLTQAGLPKIRFHDGRHTFATLMLELGESAKTVQTMLGHTKIATTLDIYSHVSLDLERKAAARLNAVLRR